MTSQDRRHLFLKEIGHLRAGLRAQYPLWVVADLLGVTLQRAEQIEIQALYKLVRRLRWKLTRERLNPLVAQDGGTGVPACVRLPVGSEGVAGRSSP